MQLRTEYLRPQFAQFVRKDWINLNETNHRLVCL
jgi:hypothetical protein